MRGWTAAFAGFGVAAASLLPARADDASTAPPAPAGALQTLDRAVSAGLLAVEGRSPRSYQQVDLLLTSRSTTPLRLDLAGRHLRPTGRSVQRLGLSHPVTPVDATPQTTPGA